MAVAISASGGNECSRSIRSFEPPLRRIVMLRSRTVGSASAAKARACERKGCRRFATGFEASTSGSTSSRVERRSTNVVLARRMNGGRRPIDSASASFWLPSARVVSLRFPIRPARSSRRSARAVTIRELSTRKRSSTGVSLVSSLKRRLEVDSAGFRYWKPTLASLAPCRATDPPSA